MQRTDRILASLLFLVILIITIYTYPEQAASVLTLTVSSVLVLIFIQHFTKDSEFLYRVFIIGLLLRVVIGLAIHILDLREFFGGDANTYHDFGTRLYNIWFEGVFTNDFMSQRALSMTNPGWGMNYFCGIIYAVTGPNILAAQFVCAVVGAATAPMLYGCALKIFNNRNVAKMSAVFVAIFPACVIWSSQLLKDGLTIFLLVLTITMVLKLQEKFSYPALVILLFALFGIISLRFYIFYVVAVAIFGSFVIGTSKSQQAIAKRLIVCLILGIGLSYLGATRNVTENFQQYGDLERIQKGRQWSAKVSKSGYGEDWDVSTTEGAISVLPVGFVYLMFAPFPWQATNLRQAIAVPETLLWWASMPLLLAGLIYTIRNRLRNAIAIILFTGLLTIAYAVTQNNVGTAYRMRTQIQVFLFLFIAVGWQLRKERIENEKIEARIKKAKIEEVRRQIQKNVGFDDESHHKK
jgi:hypothetical protein